MSVEDIASRSTVVFETWYSITEKIIFAVFRVHISPGSAATLIRRGGITNRRSIVCSLGNPNRKRTLAASAAALVK